MVIRSVMQRIYLMLHYYCNRETSNVSHWSARIRFDRMMNRWKLRERCTLNITTTSGCFVVLLGDDGHSIQVLICYKAWFGVVGALEISYLFCLYMTELVAYQLWGKKGPEPWIICCQNMDLTRLTQTNAYAHICVTHLAIFGSLFH